MSKRLQVLIPEKEYREIKRISKTQKKNVAQWVRECIREYISQHRPITPEKKIAKILRYSKFSGPTGEIEEILEEIEKGYLEK